MTRLSPAEAVAVVTAQAKTVCGGLEMMMLSGPLKKIIADLYRQIGPRGTYEQDEAVEVFVQQATLNGHSVEMVRPKIVAVVVALYAAGYVAAIDNAGFFIGRAP